MRNKVICDWLRASSFKLQACSCKILAYSLWLAACSVLLSSCATQKPSTQTPGKYHEDLSELRPKVDVPSEPDTIKTEEAHQSLPYVEAKQTVNAQVDAVLDSIDKINKTRRFIEGYTILVYTGMNREEALTKKKELSTVHPTLESELQYAQPNFRVKAGRFYTRLEAQKDYVAIKRFFPSAIVIPDKIPLN